MKKINIRISWAAWKGINSLAEIIGNIGAGLGYEVIWDLEYESRIKGWTNWFDINISKEKSGISKLVDILIIFDELALKKSLEFLKEWAIIISNEKFIKKFEEKNPEISLKNYKILDLEIEGKYDNTYLLGILSKLLDIPEDVVNAEIAKTFAKKWEEIINSNIKIVKNIVNSYSIDFDYDIKLEKVAEAQKMPYWNEMIAYWMIEWKLEYYAAYPMTPASSVLTEIINSKKINYLQAEDEISVIMAALWASYTGKRASVWTSGGWFALMTEALSFAIMSETPITAIFSQRAGPSTGTPTFHEAWDLNFALNPTFWDFEHVVLYPSSLEEAYYFGGLSLNIADKYQTVVILLTDKQMSEWHATVKELKVPKVDRWEFLENPSEDYKRYELTESWISPRVKVWTKNWDFIATSYEHWEYGETTESPEMKVKMTEKRMKKLNDFFKKEWYKGYEIINPEAKKMIVVTSFTTYTAKEFIKNNPEYGLIIIKFLKPLDHRLVEELKNVKELTFLEHNYSGQLENYMTKELKLDTLDLEIKNYRKYDLYPFYIEDLEEFFR